MTEYPSSNHTLGIHKLQNTIHIAQLSLKQGSPQLTNLFQFDIPTDNVNPLYIEKMDQQLANIVQKNLVVTLLPSTQILARQLQVPLTKEKDIQATLPFQAEQQLPYPPEEATLDSITLEKTPTQTTLTLFAAKNQHLQEHLESWAHLYVEPELVTSPAIALTNFANLYMNESPLYLLSHIDDTELTIIYVENNKPIATQSCPLLPSAKGTPTLDPEHLKRELTKLTLALNKQSNEKEPTQLFACGSRAADTNLLHQLFPETSYTLHLPAEDHPLAATKEELINNALAIGAGLTALPTQPLQINFRQNAFAYPNPWKRYKKPIAIYLALCFIAALSFFAFGQSYIERQEVLLRRDYAELLAAIGKDNQELEKEIAHKQKQPPLELGRLSPEEISHRTYHLSKTITPPDLFPLHPNVPLASDLLAWLSSHPMIMTPSTEGNSLKLENLNYTMVKRPDQSKKQERYQVKVDLEFTSPTPKLAREFHDSLIAPNPFVDPKNEVKWSSSRGKYRASFFLQDKTQYPQRRGKTS